MKSFLLVQLIVVFGAVIVPRYASAFVDGGGGISPVSIHYPPPPRYAPSTPAVSDYRSFATSHDSQSQPSRSSSSALAAIPAAAALSAAGATVANFYKTFPLVAGFLTASTKASMADSMAQYRDTSTTRFNVKRNLAMVLYSGLVLGVSVEVMYNHLFPLIFGMTTQGTALAAAVKMTLFDGFVNAPLLWLPPAYIAKAIVFKYPKREGIRKYLADVRHNGLLNKYWSLWLPATMINFLFVPDHFRVAFVAFVSFFWMIVLSVVANNNADQ